MRTETIKILTFEELSKEARQKAIEQVREEIDHDFIWYDAEKTVNEFCDLFGVKTGNRSWLDVNLNHVDDCILELSGNRLRTYLINNFGYGLFKRKYLNHGKLREERPPHHRMRKVVKIDQGQNKDKFSISYYSNIQKSTCCVLTGFCYDDNILKPVYDFIKKPNSSNFKDLMEDCFYEIEKTIKEEIEYRESEEGIIEEIESRGDYEFEEDGSIY